MKILEGPGLAYTDALQATKRGLIALTLCTIPDPLTGDESHWHRMSDTDENIHVEDIENCLTFVWTLLQQLDRQGAAQPPQINE
jgi:hypothetical protein